jgi:predicted AAA+ superfamily ATPase
MHHGEAIEEKISLSGRFGLWVGFHPFSQDQYVCVTRQWVDKLFAKQGVSFVWTEETRAAAIQWAYDKSDNSGRIAYQFACRWVGKQMLKQRQEGAS